MPAKLERDFFTRTDTLRVARDLLGKLLVVPTADGRRVSGMIVETEAYLGEIDKAAHSYGGRRTRETRSHTPKAVTFMSFLSTGCTSS